MKPNKRRAVTAKDSPLEVVIKVIRRCIRLDLNVLLIGQHGIGKTMIVVEEVRRQGLRLKYYSAATLDPWADLVGIPVPVDVSDRTNGARHKELLFVRPGDIEDAQILFFDELNRGHPRILNAVLELIQFKSINGAPLPCLRMVWAAINPPDDIYAVSELDPVLADRFHVHLSVPPCPSVAYYRDTAGIPEHVAKALIEWWEDDLNDQLRQMVSPRRLEYIARNYVNGIELRHSLPPSLKVPLGHLVRRLDGQSLLPFEITQETLVSRQQEILAEMNDGVDVMLAVSERLQRWPGVVPQCVALFLAMSSELQATLLKDARIKKPLVNLGRQGRHGDRNLRPLADRLTAMGVSLG